MSSAALLEAARRGDESAYRRLVEPHRRELHAHCYRMLGSLHDAEDALQDALLGAWRGLRGFEGRSSLRSWLYKIATNACPTMIARRPAPDEAPVEWAGIEPCPDDALGVADGYASPDSRYELRESVELAFVAALQHLPPRQRAALILCEVLGYSAREVSETLETTVPSVNSALQRARRTLDERLPERSQQATLRALGDDGVRDLVARYVDAWERGDVDAVVAMLARDATFAMPPLPRSYHGRAAIAEFLPRGPLIAPRRLLPIRANGQLAFGTYLYDHASGRFRANAVQLIALRGDQVAEIVAFLTPEALDRFGLPPDLPG